MSSAQDKASLVAGPEHEGMCFVQRLHPESSYLNQAASLHIDGHLQVDLLQAAWRDVVRRHEPLRYEFHNDGQALHIVRRDELQVPMLLEDAGHLQDREALHARIRTLSQRAFDPGSAPLIRAYVLQHTPERHTVVYITHHVITDRWSLGLVARDLMAWYRHYADGEPAPAPLKTTYGEHCATRLRAPPEALDEAVARWRELLAEDPPSGFIRPDNGRSAAPSFEADRRTLTLGESELNALKSFARSQRVSLSMALIAGWAALLRRYVPSESVCIGLPVAHRPDSALAPIHTLPLMRASQQQQLLSWGRQPHKFEQTDLVQMIKQRLHEDPEAPAVFVGDLRLTREALAERVDALAGSLTATGLPAGGIVAVHLERGLSSVIAILATVQAGGAYLPLEPQLPSQRQRFIMGDAAPSVMITGHARQHLDPSVAVIVVDEQGRSTASAPDGPATSPAGPGDVINLIYTSGSTGEPKGVLGAHASVLNRVQWAAHAYPPQPGECWAHKTALAFVDAVFEVFAPIALGVPLVIIPQHAATDPRRLLSTVAAQGVTRLVVVPSKLEALLDEIDRGGPQPSLHLWTSSGEPLSAGLVQRFAKLLPGQTLLNLYGSTETGADATAWACEVEAAGTQPPIGRPITNLEVQVRDPQGALVPIGVPGELFIGGTGLAAGYHRRPELNRAAFCEASAPNAVRFFRTGDRARWRPDGQLEYWGRRDRQVKLRGVRIELGAVEAALLSCPGVREAAAIIHGEGAHRRLVGYVCPPEALQGLAEALREQLPQLQSPSQFVGVAAMPRTATGKLNRDALLSPSIAEGHRAESGPKDKIETRLLALWREILKRDIAVEDDFFASGGHSLLAVRLFARIEDDFKVQLPLPLIFHAPSVRQLVEHVHQARAAAHPWHPLVPIQPAGTQPPLFLVHRAPGTVQCYGELARRLGPDQPVFGLQARGLNGVQPPTSSIEQVAKDSVASLQPVRGHGPVRLGGWSMGGVIALEMARQLQAQGRAVQLVLLFDTHAPSPNEVHALARRARRWVRHMRGRPDPVAWVEDLAPNLRAVARANLHATGAYRATMSTTQVALFRPKPVGGTHVIS